MNANICKVWDEPDCSELEKMLLTRRFINEPNTVLWEAPSEEACELFRIDLQSKGLFAHANTSYLFESGVMRLCFKDYDKRHVFLYRS
jgi:hypothetical protein